MILHTLMAMPLKAATASIIAVAGFATSVHAQSSWLNPADGSWFESANWDTAMVPGSADQVTLGLVGGYTVTVPGSADALQLSITNPDAMLHIDNARTLDLFGDLTNEGLIIVNPAGGGSFTQFDFESDAMISGSGEIRLGSFGTRARLRTGAGLSVTQGASHSVTGVGTIEAAMVNDGTVDANLTGQLLTLSLNTKVNSGVMRASNAGVLDIRAIVINQGPTGIIEAIDASSEVQLNASTIVGGTLRTDLDAGINVNSATLDGVKLAEGSLNLLNARTLDVLNSITNNGTININPIAGGSATQLDFETSGSFNGSGEVVLGSVGSRARLRTGVGFTMTNSTTHTIRGYGQIEAALINDGLVNADVPGNELLFQTRDKLNNSTIQAINAGILDFGNITVDQQGGGLLLADGAGSRIDFNSSTIVGGTVRATNDAIAEIITATFDGVIVEGVMNLANARTLTVLNSITNNGTITVNPISGQSVTQLDFENSGSLLGNGTVVLNSFGSRARLRTDPGAVMTNSPTHTIRGYGTIEAAMINDGLVQSDVLSQELGLITNDKVNNATMQAINGGVLDFGPIAVQQSNVGQIIADGMDARVDFNGATVTGGIIETRNGGIIEIVTVTYDGVTSNADTVIPNGRTLNIRSGMTNNGTIQVNPTAGGSTTSIRWVDDAQIDGDGIISLGGLATRARFNLLADATTAALGAGQRLEGIGSIDAPLIHHGTTAPGLGVGTLLASGDITFSISSVFEVEVNTDGADLLDSSKSIELAGALEVHFVDGFAPTGFWARKVMEGSSITEKFDSIVIPAPPAGFVTRVFNDGTQVLVGQTCPSDTNLDGNLNFFDVSVFLSNYNAGSLDADLNNDGTLNFFDVSTFLSSYNAGC